MRETADLSSTTGSHVFHQGHGKRYAIYFTPAKGSPLTRAGEAWFGRSAFAKGGFETAPKLAANDGETVGNPRRYGFHATLKPPFRLAEGRTVEELEYALDDFAQRNRSCPIGTFELARLRGFFALVPKAPLLRLNRFAATIVEAFDGFRAPFNTAELQHRLEDDLDDDEATLLVRWGYPYVFERFQFHMTLTNRLAPSQQIDVSTQLQSRFGPVLAEEHIIDALTLFEQAGPSEDFTVRARFPLREMARL